MLARSAAPVQIDVSLGLAETVLAVDGVPVALDRHLRRLARSCADVFGMPLPPHVAERARERAAGQERARLAITAVPRAGAIDVALDLTDAPLPADAATLEPVLLAGGLGRHKWRDRTGVELLEHDVAPALPLLVDGNGDVLETTRTNVFVVRDGVVVTPPADDRVLPGVTRERVLVAAAAVRVPALESRIEVEELADADEIFVTSALRGVQPVGRRGPVTDALARALEDVR